MIIQKIIELEKKLKETDSNIQMDEYETMYHQENLDYLNSQDIIAPSYANVY
jgi:hypothetical protein